MPPFDRVPEFDRLRVAVVGDLIADHFLITEPKGLSREAPVMVLRHASERTGAGGAANVACNLRALGAHTRILGAVGRDARGRELLEILEQEGIESVAVESVAGWSTPSKTRVLAAEPRRSPHQVLRVDRDPSHPVELSVRRGLADRVRALEGQVDALVVSDYGYGLLDGEVAAAAVELSRKGVQVVLDPRGPLEPFAGITALSPNVGELARFTGEALERLEDTGVLRTRALELLERLRTRWLLVTRGNRGMALFGEGLPEEGVAVEASGSGTVTDVSGAGDTAAAVFALALASGSSAPDAMRLANAASGVVVMENGAAVCTLGQLRSALPLCPVPTRLPLSEAP